MNNYLLEYKSIHFYNGYSHILRHYTRLVNEEEKEKLIDIFKKLGDKIIRKRKKYIKAILKCSDLIIIKTFWYDTNKRN